MPLRVAAKEFHYRKDSLRDESTDYDRADVLKPKCVEVSVHSSKQEIQDAGVVLCKVPRRESTEDTRLEKDSPEDSCLDKGELIVFVFESNSFSNFHPHCPHEQIENN